MTELYDIVPHIALEQSPLLRAEAANAELPLGQARRGFVGRIRRIATGGVASSLSGEELERRLLELGFAEGARVEILHEGVLGRDPIAVRVDNVTIAIRRREAMAIIVA